MYQSNFYLGLALVLGQLASSLAPPSPAHKRGGEQYEAKDKLGAVASESTVCSQIGIDLIKGGGNAADAICFKCCARRNLGPANGAALIFTVGGHSVLYRGNRDVP